MPKNEDGEFELILANRQLLSVFFIVVILLGVFFTMGYIVGRNSAPLVADASPAPKGDGKPLVSDSPTPPAAAAAETAAPAETAPQRPVATEPQKADPEPEPAKPAPVRRAPAKAAANNQPVPGQAYLQLAATSQREADIMVDVLRKKEFQAMAAEIEEKPGTFRVLVGPVTESTANKLRGDLQGAGFPGNAAIRRTF